MKTITLTTQKTKDILLLLMIAKRLNIKTVIKKDEKESYEKKLTFMSMRLSEKSLAKDWENEDDEYWKNI